MRPLGLLVCAGLCFGQAGQQAVMIGLGNPVLATPTFSPGAGTYSSTQSVTITIPGGSTGWYNNTGTFTGCTPSACSGATQLSGAVSVSTTQTLYAIATEVGYTNSAVGSAAYTITGNANCGFVNPSGGTNNTAINNLAVGQNCVTGSDASGYAVVNGIFYSGGGTASTVYMAIYTNNSGKPGNKVCAESTGVSTPTSAGNVTDAALGTACNGTLLSASTEYWILFDVAASGAAAVHVPSANCAGGLASEYISQTAGTWPANGASYSNAGNCYLEELTLTPQ